MGTALAMPRHTVEELERFPNDGSRYEPLDGALLVTSAPSATHRIVASRIQSRLSVALAAWRCGTRRGCAGRCAM